MCCVSAIHTIQRNEVPSTEFRLGPTVSGREEIVDYLHSSLRNVTERTFDATITTILHHVVNTSGGKYVRGGNYHGHNSQLDCCCCDGGKRVELHFHDNLVLF